MKTKCYNKDETDCIVQDLKAGKTVAFPTDTVYGLGVIYNENALNALKQAKGRDEAKPIPTMVASYEQLAKIAVITASAQKLIEAFMPGAITLVLTKKEGVPAYATNGKATIAVRMPDDPFVLSLIQRCGSPLLVSSANRSDEPSTFTTAEVLKQLDGRIDSIVNGKAAGNAASTIVDATTASIKILRVGMIDEKAITAVLTQ